MKPEAVLTTACSYIKEMQATLQPKGKRIRRARNYDEVLTWIEQKVFTWDELGVPPNHFMALLTGVLQKCPELEDNPQFKAWVISDLGRRFENVVNGTSEAGSPMARIVPFRKTAA